MNNQMVITKKDLRTGDARIIIKFNGFQVEGVIPQSELIEFSTLPAATKEAIVHEFQKLNLPLLTQCKTVWTIKAMSSVESVQHNKEFKIKQNEIERAER